MFPTALSERHERNAESRDFRILFVTFLSMCSLILIKLAPVLLPISVCLERRRKLCKKKTIRTNRSCGLISAIITRKKKEKKDHVGDHFVQLRCCFYSNRC